jgi:hypothetical protein
MKKTVYTAPAMEVVALKIQNHLLAGSSINGGDGQGSSAGGSGSFGDDDDLG